MENPVDRLSRLISETFWTGLVRRLDETTIEIAIKDTKVVDKRCSRVYVPVGAPKQIDYYTAITKQRPELGLEVKILPPPQDIPSHLREYRDEPGVLALAMSDEGDGLQGFDYIVPGGRFNEFYYWDSFFCALGLLEAGKTNLVCNILKHMMFQIEHYGCVLNGSRSYYLQRSQPPFLTTLARKTFDRLSTSSDEVSEKTRSLLRGAIKTAIKEYETFWACEPRLDPKTGLSRYRPQTAGVPPEVEPGHFDYFLQGEAAKRGMSISQLTEDYNAGRLADPGSLDDFFQHDVSVRENGHDTSARLVGVSADLATIDLNSCLFKYEEDIAWAIKHVFDGELDGHTPATWEARATKRKNAVHRYLWNDEVGAFYDYNTATQTQTTLLSAPVFWSLWSGLATGPQAARIVREILPIFEHVGGIVSQPRCAESDRLPRQWDYPAGWAPHQILAWEGLQRYGYHAEAQRLAYRWLGLITQIFAEYGGRVTEKYDVTRRAVSAAMEATEYGNQGSGFVGVNLEGFGWTNSSYQLGLKILDEILLRALKQGLLWEEIDR